ncbi:MAG: DUF1257 domain-containing protein [Chloroflexota bacterium]
MSHFSRVGTKLKDRDMLVRCLKGLGYRVDLNGEIRGFQGTQAVEVAARAQQGYDIGFLRDEDGCYAMIADWWGVHGTTQAQFSARLEQQFEEVQRRIRREYALQTVLEQTAAQGFNVVEQETAKDGTIRIVVRRWV